MSTGPLGADFCHFRRTETARESELGLIFHNLIAKNENRVFLKSGPAEYEAGSDATSAIVTPRNSTANPGPTGMVSIDDLPSLNLAPNGTRWQRRTSAGHFPLADR